MSMYKKSLKKLCAVSLIAAMIVGGSVAAMPATAADNSVMVSAAKSAADYTYVITPILSPFNEYFFVKTDNPDPTSFRFADQSSKYSDESTITFDYDDWNEEVKLYADIKYENEETGRVNGGYIFKSFNTDGGEIVLQSKNDAYYSWDVTWSDTSVKLKLPILKDDVDYLIDTYATKTRFFDNMDAVQSGFSSICLYSGSFIRGELYKSGSYWSLSTSPHRDQTFYLQSPYSRKDNKSLFASAIYPFRYDSLGFPSMMGAVSKRLDSSSSSRWNSSYHYIIDVTYDGETRTYGGQGSGDGQGISEDKVQQYFTFGTNGTKITLNNTRQLLENYAAVEMNDDVPRADALTWKDIYDTVGSEGAWLRLMDNAYTYLYQKGDGTYYWAEAVGDDGTEIYWDGDLGYVSDTWVDGRYIDSWEKFVRGAKFEDHPTSNIMMKQMKVPLITCDAVYRYNDSVGQYEKDYSNIEITEKQENVLFRYDTDNNIWTAEYDELGNGYCEYNDIVMMTEKGLIDEKYLDMVTLTTDEVKALKVDKNTNTVPLKGYIYDGTAEPGTPYAYVSETGVTLNKTKLTLEKNKTATLTATISPSNATNKTIIWTTSNSSVATVSNGKITAIGPGTATITAKTNNGKTASCKVTVTTPVSSVKLSKTSLTLIKGTSETIKATITPSNAANKTVTWSTSNSKVATVSNGKVTAISAGTATITAKSNNGKTASCKVTVKAPTVPKDNGSQLVDNAGVGGGSVSTWVNWNNITAKSNFKGEGGWKYKYSYKNDKDNKWVDMTGYITSSSYRLPKFTTAGNYTIRIAAIDKYGQYASKYTYLMVKQDSKKALKDNGSKLSAITVSKGQTITMSSKFTGGVVPYRYKYAYRKNGGAWVAIAQPKHDNTTGYSTDDNFSFKLPSQSGTYTIKVVCRDGVGKTCSKDINVTVK